MAAPEDGGRETRLDPEKRRGRALALAFLVLAFSAFSLSQRRQLGLLGGLTDEWDILGANLAVHGTIGLEDEPWLLRPPGYPAFIAVPLLIAGPPRVVTVAYVDRAAPLVYSAQAVALAAASVLLFLWLAQSVPWPQAFAAGLVLGANPLSLTLVGLRQYAVVHILALVSGLWALDHATSRWPGRRLPMVGAGIVWGLVTLVRPVTLLLPPFVFALLLLRRPRSSFRSAGAATAIFCLGMVATIGPWTARNWAVSGRFVPVNLQGWANVWAATLRPLPVQPDSYRWFAIGSDILRVHRLVSGQPEYDLLTYVKFNAETEQAYRREALANLRRQPMVYLGNVARSFRSLMLDTNTVYLRLFRYLQTTDVAVQQTWFEAGRQPRLGSVRLGRAFALLSGALGALSVVGILSALRSRKGPLLTTTLVAACFLVVHSIAHMEFTYLYVKLPFLAVLAFVPLGLPRTSSEVPGRLARAADLLTTALAVSSVVLTALLLRP
ncbi:MAG: hypothetical protein LJF30_15615 [Acidobacteria bacterium]|nr:hypothetical protein [Acidobacteriota bacterium]